MTDSQTTRASLIVRIRDQNDRESWARFAGIYSPLIWEHLRRRGLQAVDAEDVAQEVLARVAAAVTKFEYDPAKGTFRGWLFTIVENCRRRLVAARRSEGAGSGDTRLLRALHNVPDGDSEAEWNQEYQRHLLRHAAEEVRGEFQDRTWRAFWETAVEGHTPPEVASELGMTIAAVYMAKHRVTKRLRECIHYLEGGQP